MSSPILAIVLPTYNEAGNLPTLVRGIYKQQPSCSPYTVHVVVVDGASRDGTEETVRALAADFPSLHFLQYGKRGYGPALQMGLRYARQELGAQLVGQMDADLSHDPAAIPQLVRRLEDDDLDMAIGSRYLAPDGLQLGWKRRLTSRTAALIGRLCLGVPVRDLGNGLRLLRGDLLDELERHDLPWQGRSFAILPALVFRTVIAGGRVGEVATVFRQRQSGTSKMSFGRYIREFLAFAVRQRESNLARSLRFTAVGAVGLVINAVAWRLLFPVLSGDVGLRRFSLDSAQLVAGELALLSNFTLNSLWTFRTPLRHPSAVVRFAGYQAVAYMSVLISSWVIAVLKAMFGASPHLWYVLAGVGAGYTWNLLWSLAVVFRRRVRPLRPAAAFRRPARPAEEALTPPLAARLGPVVDGAGRGKGPSSSAGRSS